MTLRVALLILVLAALLASGIAPYDRGVWWAEVAPVLIALPILLASARRFPLTPLTSLLSRRHEYEADAYAAEQTSATDLAQALVKLYEDNAATLTPDPLHSLFYDSHPPAALRVARLSA